jgi:hypothetical protein
VSLRALTDDLILPPGLSIEGPASRTHRSDRIAGIKNTGPIHIDLTEDLDSGSESIAIRGPRTKGGAATGGIVRKGPKTRGGAAIGGTARGGAATGGTARGGAATDWVAARGGVVARGGGATARGGATRGGGTAAVQGRGGGNVSSSNQVKGKQIVTSIQKGIEIMESKMKRKEQDWKP